MKFSFKKYKDQYPKAVKVLIKCPSLFTFYRYPGVIRRSIVIDYNKNLRLTQCVGSKKRRMIWDCYLKKDTVTNQRLHKIF